MKRNSSNCYQPYENKKLKQRNVVVIVGQFILAHWRSHQLAIRHHRFSGDLCHSMWSACMAPPHVLLYIISISAIGTPEYV